MKAEQYIKDYTRNCSNELSNGEYESWLTPDHALRAVEIAKKDVIDKACSWFADRYQVNGSYLCADDIEDFVKFMKGE